MDKPVSIEIGNLRFMVKTELDECADTDDLGKFTSKFDPPCFDRKDGILYGDTQTWNFTFPEELIPVVEKYAEQLRLTYNDYWRRRATVPIPDGPPQMQAFCEVLRTQALGEDFDLDDWIEPLSDPGQADIYMTMPEMLATGLNCPWEYRDHRYFKPTNHLPHNPKNWEHCSPDSLAGVIADYGSLEKADIAYAIADWERAESYGKDWSMLGVVVQAYAGDWLIQTDSVWGIESDSDYWKTQAVDIAKGMYFSLMTEGFAHHAKAIQAARRSLKRISPDQLAERFQAAL